MSLLTSGGIAWAVPGKLVTMPIENIVAKLRQLDAGNDSAHWFFTRSTPMPARNSVLLSSAGEVLSSGFTGGDFDLPTFGSFKKLVEVKKIVEERAFITMTLSLMEWLHYNHGIDVSELDIEHDPFHRLANALAKVLRGKTKAITYSPAQIMEKVGCGNDTLRAYTELAKVAKAKVGGKDHRFTLEETVSILEAFANGNTQKFVRAANVALEEIRLK